MSPIVVCDHCKGRKTCTASGGRSCQVCLEASGIGKRQWATVRCSYCGGTGRVRIRGETPPEKPAETPPAEQEAEEAT